MKNLLKPLWGKGRIEFICGTLCKDEKIKMNIFFRIHRAKDSTTLYWLNSLINLSNKKPAKTVSLAG